MVSSRCQFLSYITTLRETHWNHKHMQNVNNPLRLLKRLNTDDIPQKVPINNRCPFIACWIILFLQISQIMFLEPWFSITIQVYSQNSNPKQYFCMLTLEIVIVSILSWSLYLKYRLKVTLTVCQEWILRSEKWFYCRPPFCTGPIGPTSYRNMDDAWWQAS